MITFDPDNPRSFVSKGGYDYLASPYSHDDPIIQEERYLQAVRAFRFLTARGSIIFSPIIHCHELAKIIRLPGNHEWWKRYDEAMLIGAATLIILRTEGWETSKGIKNERAFAEEHGIPVELL